MSVLIEQLLEGNVAFDEVCGSTSQLTAAFLAAGRFEALPPPYEQEQAAWDRLDNRQRMIVREFNPRSAPGAGAASAAMADF